MKKPRLPLLQNNGIDIFQRTRAALKEIGEDSPERLREIATKCGCDYDTVIANVYRPYGGAESFDDLQTYMRAETRRMAFNELNWQFNGLLDNIQADANLTEADRASRIIALAEDFASRAAAVPAHADAEVADDMVEAAEDVSEADDTRGGWWAQKRRQKAAVKDQPILDATSNFVAFKEGDTWRFVTAYSNRYYDNLKEVFPEASHERFLAWADADPPGRYPELWDWHTPVGVSTYGMKEAFKLGMGRADFLDYQDGIAVAAGYFYPEFNDAAEALSKTPGLGVSHGFGYAPWALNEKDGSYSEHFVFELSPLPRARAANFGTTFLTDLGIKEKDMNFRPDRRAFLVGIHGETKVKAMEKTLGDVATNMKDSGVDFKDFAAELANMEPAPAAAPAAAVTPVSESTPTPAAGDSLAAITNAVKEGLAPIAASVEDLTKRMGALETSQKDVDARAAELFGPRMRPPAAAGTTPSEDPSNVVRGNSRMVAAAKDGAQETPLNIPPHLVRYAGMLGLQPATDAPAVADINPPAAVSAEAAAATA